MIISNLKWYLHSQEFKLNPNAPSFTPSFSSPRPASPVVQSSPVYMHASLPPPTPIQGVPVGIQYMQPQQNQPGQFPQFNNSVVPVSPVASSTPFMPSPGFVPAYTGGGVSGGGVLQPGQPSMKVPPHSQQQVCLQSLFVCVWFIMMLNNLMRVQGNWRYFVEFPGAWKFQFEIWTGHDETSVTLSCFLASFAPFPIYI